MRIDHSGDDFVWDDSCSGESGIAVRFETCDGSSTIAPSGCGYLDETVASIGFYIAPHYIRRGS